MEKIQQHIEAIIFASEEPISASDIKSCLEQSMETKVKKKLLEEALESILLKYQSEEYPFEIVEIAGGYQYMTKGAFHHTISVLLKQNARRRLSVAALETLSIIAYKQPCTRTEAEAIRGVSCDYSIQKLLEKDLIAIIGRSDKPGRPLLYGTSEKFMDYFGLKSVKDLPQLKDFSSEDNMIGEGLAIEEKQLEEGAIEININNEEKAEQKKDDQAE